ncbi:integrator complex subunit 4-like [Macrosteles quadrilineatus]|uniref:integrator complex subunit 4-like n=1 Tax=Macrosteles quadrilineatus TaxID=74068 RepID=UPI0023E3090F|nr:integrator complex subunit 4-like [Macrosteles quadrilineatus]
MAAVLKKRALAEYSQVIQEQPVKPFKKLRLVKKKWVDNSAASVFIGLLEKQRTSNEAFQLLLRISDTPHLPEEDVAVAVKKLVEYYQQQTESFVRIKILSVFADIGSEPGADVQSITEETLGLLKKETSHHVKAQGLATLLRLVKLTPDNTIAHNKLIALAKQYLSDTSHLVKQKALDVLGELLPITQQAETTLRLIGDYTLSQDARVRSTAFNTMVVLHNRGLKLPASLYKETCEALKDDYEIVRRSALQLIYLLAITYPEHPTMLADTEEELRLVDDAFGKICNAVNDLSMRVRTQAAQLLGNLTLVSPKFLHQTLDKKLFSNMRKKRSAHERAWESVTSGEWSSGKRWADDAPQELLDAQQINLISSGSCGAFVHGLEDEFLEVRSASVDSICSLSLNNPQFANLALDFLVDMFNDEIEDVRIKAIDSLTKISRHTVLREDQLETILGALEDVSMDVREGLHRMLAACTLSTKGCLQMCVESLLDNLKKYPQDKKSTWKCMQRMGSRHPELTLPLVPELLSIHPFFDTAEPDVEEPAYICILILVFNAAKHCPTMLQLFEETTVKHYSYLRDTMPQLVPPLKLGSLPAGELETLPSSTPQFLTTLLSRLEGAPNSRVHMELLLAAERDLNRLATIDPTVSGAAQFTALYITSQLLMSKVLANKMWCSNAANTLQANSVRNSITQLMQHCFKLQHLFTGLRPADRAVVKQFKVKTLALQLVHVVKASNHSALALCHHFLTQVEQTQRFLSEHGIAPDAFTLLVFKSTAALEEAKPGAVARMLLPLLQTSAPSNPPRPHTDVKMCHAVMSMPSASADSALKFTAGLVMGIPLDAELYSLHNTNTLRLKVKYPDQQTQLIVPRKSDLRLLNLETSENSSALAQDYRLMTTVLICHQVWTEALYVDISLAMDLTELEPGVSHNQEPCCIDLCKPVKVYVSPKPVRRGI